MQAFGIKAYDEPIEAQEVEEPTVGDHDLLVEIRAAGVNVLDAKIRRGAFKMILPYELPLTLGHDLAGTVVAVGSAVARYAVGDEVYGRVRDHRIGTFAERIAVHEDDVARKPVTLSMAEAGAVPLVALTAWQALVEIANVQPGQSVLIHAGSGGVGSWAIQLAKHLGATVATTTGPDNLDWVRALGADRVIDYRSEDFAAALDGYDVVLDTQGGDTLARSLRVLRPGGIAIGITGPPDPAYAREQGFSWPLRLAMSLLSLRIRRAASRRGVRYVFLFMRAEGAQLAEIAALIDAGRLRPVIDRSYPFDQTLAALSYVEDGHAKGKVVVIRD